MDGNQYEHYCAEQLKKNGFSNVQVTKGSGDQGIDVIAYKNGERYGIQCKYYSSPVGNFAVQEAYAGAKYYNCNRAAVLTNNTFTKSAKELAKSTNVMLWENNHVPFSVGQSKIIKWLGIFMCAISALGLLIIREIENVKLPVLQRIYLILTLLGGICNVVEFGQCGMSVLACLFYFLAFVASVITGFAINGSLGEDSLFMCVAFLISLLRTKKLFKPQKEINLATKEF